MFLVRSFGPKRRERCFGLLVVNTPKRFMYLRRESYYSTDGENLIARIRSRELVFLSPMLYAMPLFDSSVLFLQPMDLLVVVLATQTQKRMLLGLVLALSTSVRNVALRHFTTLSPESCPAILAKHINYPQLMAVPQHQQSRPVLVNHLVLPHLPTHLPLHLPLLLHSTSLQTLNHQLVQNSRLHSLPLWKRLPAVLQPHSLQTYNR